MAWGEQQGNCGRSSGIGFRGQIEPESNGVGVSVLTEKDAGQVSGNRDGPSASLLGVIPGHSQSERTRNLEFVVRHFRVRVRDAPRNDYSIVKPLCF
jgi:hypothetical protein